jgi:uncharacterized membrane protein
MADILIVFTLIATLACGIIAGVFYAFSTIIMNGLGRIPGVHGVAAMRGINNAVINRLFLGPYLGAVLLCALIVVVAPFAWSAGAAALAVLGALAYIIGTFVVTIVFSVPLNNRLEEAKADDPETMALWNDYLQRWTMWNHVRTGAAVAATALFIVAVCATAG